MDQQQRDAYDDIHLRRIQAFRNASGKGMSTLDHLAAVEEATTQEDIGTLNAIRKTLPEDVQEFISLYVSVWRSFGKYRCSVCGRTEAQSEAIGYDCAREC